MIKASKDNSELVPEIKKRGRKKSDSSTPKGIGLFEHIKHIRCIQDPDYYKNLTDLDKKSFNPFMIFKALSMNPALLPDIADLFKYFDKIPHPQIYQLLIGLIPLENPRIFHPWIKPSKKSYGKKIVELLTTYFEISSKEAEEYAGFLYSTDNGKKELENLCRDFGLETHEIKDILENKNEEK